MLLHFIHCTCIKKIICRCSDRCCFCCRCRRRRRHSSPQRKPIVQATLLIINIIISRVRMYLYRDTHTHARSDLTYTLRDDVCIWFSVTPPHATFKSFHSYSYSSFSHIHVPRMCNAHMCVCVCSFKSCRNQHPYTYSKFVIVSIYFTHMHNIL